MKRKIIVSLVALLGLSGCKMDLSVNQAEDLPLSIEQLNQDAYIRQAELSDDEKMLLKLVTENEVIIWDYRVGENVRSIHLRINYLNNEEAKWESLEMGSSVNDPDMLESSNIGRIMINFDADSNGIEIAEMTDFEKKQPGNYTLTRWHSPEENEIDFSGMAIGSYHSSPLEYVENEEIVLYQRVATANNAIRTMSEDDFKHPEKLAEMNYDYVCVITIEFSTEPLN